MTRSKLRNCNDFGEIGASKKPEESGLQYPLGESNPCLRTENPMSWATRRRGRGMKGYRLGFAVEFNIYHGLVALSIGFGGLLFDLIEPLLDLLVGGGLLALQENLPNHAAHPRITKLGEDG